jgi:CheY-like chemotaxis protein
MTKPLRILVAEDDPNDILLLQRAFAKTGLAGDVEFVRDGQETIDYLQELKSYDVPTDSLMPTLLLLDLKMPRLNGFEVLEWLRQQPRFEKLLVVVFSSSDQPADRSRACALGAHAYLVKPGAPGEFVNVVRELQQYWLRVNSAESPVAR